MNSQLQKDKTTIGDILRKTVDIAEDHYHAQDILQPSLLVKDDEFIDLPRNGQGAEATLDLFHKRYAPAMAKSAGTH